MTGEAEKMLNEAMKPLLPFLADETTEDIAAQEPGVCWVYRNGNWHREAVALSGEGMWEIAKLGGSLTHKNVDESAPLLDARLPRGERLQACLPPAVGETSFSIRKPSSRLPLFEEAPALYRTEGWNQPGEARAGRDMSELLALYREKDFWAFLRAAVKAKLEILFAGDTGSGKTTIANLAATAMALDERIITIEDAEEMELRQPNVVKLFYASDGQGPVTVQSLQEAALRMRPDRILIQEVRQEEVAWIYVRRKGHHGTLATIHAYDVPSAAQNLFQLFKGSQRGRGFDDGTAIDTIANAVDVIVPLDRDDKVSIGATWFRAEAELRGQTFADLLR